MISLLTRRFGGFPEALFVCCLALGGTIRSSWAQMPSDVVSRGDIVYDLLDSLAASGRLPGYTLRDFARGDRLYTRTEIAQIIERALPDTTGPSDRFASAERILRERFAPELHRDDPVRFPLDPRVAARGVEIGGWVKARLLSDPSAVSAVGRFALELPFGRDGYAAMSGGDWRDEWYGTGSNLEVAPGRYGEIETAYAHVNGRALDVSIGQMLVRWGPGYSGSLLLGDSASSIPQVAVDKTFLLPGSFGHHLGRLSFDEFVGEFFEKNTTAAYPDAEGSSKYLVGRRFVAQGGPWSFSIAEAMKSTRLPDPEWAALLPLYLYQNEWTQNRKQHFLPFLATQRETDTYWKNYQSNATISYSADRRNGLLLYTDFLVDDVKSPDGIGNGYPTTQKLGEQYGIYLPHIGSETGHYGVRIEYSTIDPATYTNASLPVAWDAKGLPLAYPTGPNANVLFGRVDAAVSEQVRLALEGQTRRDRGTPILGFTSASEDRIGAYATYSLSRRAFLGARYEHLRAAAYASDATTNKVELNAGIGF